MVRVGGATVFEVFSRTVTRQEPSASLQGRIHGVSERGRSDTCAPPLFQRASRVRLGYSSPRSAKLTIASPVTTR
jgi:hypothetical protein